MRLQRGSRPLRSNSTHTRRLLSAVQAPRGRRSERGSTLCGSGGARRWPRLEPSKTAVRIAASGAVDRRPRAPGAPNPSLPAFSVAQCAAAVIGMRSSSMPQRFHPSRAGRRAATPAAPPAATPAAGRLVARPSGCRHVALHHCLGQRWPSPAAQPEWQRGPPGAAEVVVRLCETQPLMMQPLLRLEG